MWEYNLVYKPFELHFKHQAYIGRSTGKPPEPLSCISALYLRKEILNILVALGIWSQP